MKCSVLIVLFAQAVNGIKLNQTSAQTSRRTEEDPLIGEYLDKMAKNGRLHPPTSAPGCVYIPNVLGFNLGTRFIPNDVEVCNGDAHLIPDHSYQRLRVHPSGQISVVFWVILAGLILIVAGVKYWEHRVQIQRKSYEVSRSILLLTLACYACFIPGVVYPVVGVDLRVHVPVPFQLHLPLLGHISSIAIPCFPLPAATMLESMITIIKDLFHTGCPTAGVFCAIYALVIPIWKLILFVCIYGISQTPGIEKSDKLKPWLERCVYWVRLISKYDSPKLFVYLFLKMTFDGLHTPPRITAESQIDLGYVLYALFAVGTLLGCICHPDFGVTTKYGKTFKRVAKSAEHVPWSKSGLTIFTTFAMVVFLFLLIVGSMLPLCSLHLDVHPQQYGQLAPIIQSLQLNRDVTFSLAGCITHYAKHLAVTDVNPLICFLMLLIFCFCIPIMRMGAYVVAAFCRRSSERKTQQTVAAILWWSEWLEYMEMIDVMLIGVLGMFATSGPALVVAGVTMGVHVGCFLLIATELWCWAVSMILSGDGAFYIEGWPEGEEMNEQVITNVKVQES